MAGLDSFNQMKKETKRLGNKKKVSVFWDIENVRPKKNSSVLNFVGKVRNLFVEDFFEAGFIVVCDVRKEAKDLVDQLNEVQIQVQHVSGDKKNTSDEVLRQEMRRFVDMSTEPGRIVLISGDSDFSADLHSFRYRKGFEIILLHNSQAKPALIQCANQAIPFEKIANGLESKNKGDEKGASKGKCVQKSGNVLKCLKGHKLVSHKPDKSGWYCDASDDKGGCKRGLAGNSNSASIPYHICQTCKYYLCDKCADSRSMTNQPASKIKPVDVVIKCKKGHKLVFRKPNSSEWFCDASCEAGGCKRALTCGGNSSAKFSYYHCNACDYDLCDLCFEHKKSKEPNTHTNVKHGKETKKTETKKTEAKKTETKKSEAKKKNDCSKHNMQQIRQKGQTWFCSKSREAGGCLQNIKTLANWEVPYFTRCQFCNYHLCDLCDDDDTDSENDDDSDGQCEEHNMQSRKPTNAKWFCAKSRIQGMGCFTTQCGTSGIPYQKCQFCDFVFEISALKKKALNSVV